MMAAWIVGLMMLVVGAVALAIALTRGGRRRNRRGVQRVSERSEIQELAPDGGLAEGEEVGGGD